MARIAAWIAAARPAALVVDVSVEVAVLGRLMGIPILVVALPGDRTDPAHQLGLLAGRGDPRPLARRPGRHGPRPAPVGRPDPPRRRALAVRRPHRRSRRLHGPRRRVLVLQGTGGTSIGPADLAAAAAATPDWDWHRLGPGAWAEDPWPELCAADVVVTHAGLGALADVAAAGRPAVVIPEDRPHDEQRATARALADAGLAVTVRPLAGRARVAGPARAGTRRRRIRWRRWGTDGAAARAARVIEAVAADQRCRRPRRARSGDHPGRGPARASEPATAGTAAQHGCRSTRTSSSAWVTAARRTWPPPRPSRRRPRSTSRFPAPACRWPGRAMRAPSRRSRPARTCWSSWTSTASPRPAWCSGTSSARIEDRCSATALRTGRLPSPAATRRIRPRPARRAGHSAPGPPQPARRPDPARRGPAAVLVAVVRRTPRRVDGDRRILRGVPRLRRRGHRLRPTRRGRRRPSRLDRRRTRLPPVPSLRRPAGRARGRRPRQRAGLLPALGLVADDRMADRVPPPGSGQLRSHPRLATRSATAESPLSRGRPPRTTPVPSSAPSPTGRPRRRGRPRCAERTQQSGLDVGQALLEFLDPLGAVRVDRCSRGWAAISASPSDSPLTSFATSAGSSWAVPTQVPSRQRLTFSRPSSACAETRTPRP